MFRISSLVRGAALAAAVTLCSLPSLASAHHGGCYPTVSYCQPCYTQCYTPCYRPLIVSQPLFYSQPVLVQPCARPVIVTPYVQPACRVIIR